MLGMNKFDVIIVGGGAAGAAAARELSKYECSVALLEKEIEVSMGVTKGTHAIVHCGIPEPDAPLYNRGQVRGNLMLEQICRDLDVPFKRIGKLLVGFNEKDTGVLESTLLGARRNGVYNAELITDRDRIREMEPELTESTVSALYTPTTGIVSPWALCYGLIENAQNNGVSVITDAEVLSIDKQEEGLILSTTQGEYQASLVINAAGAFSEKLAGLIEDTSFRLVGSRHQRIIMDKNCNGIVKHLVRGLGPGGWGTDFVCPTVYGDVLVGVCTEGNIPWNDCATTREGLEDTVIPNYLKLIPGLAPANSIKPFSGFLYEVEGTANYVVRPSAVDSRMIHMVLGGSGLTSSVAMAEYIAEEVIPALGIKFEKKKDFDPIRKDIPHFSDLSNEERAALIEKDPLYGHVICRCETVTEGEIVEAIRRGARTRDGVKFRTHAGLGRCQGGFCGPRVIEILARELGIPAEQVTRKGKGSLEVPYAIKELLFDPEVQA